MARKKQRKLDFQLLEFPDEIIYLVLRYLTNVSDIYHFCKTCKRIQNMFVKRIEERSKEVAANIFCYDGKDLNHFACADGSDYLYLYFMLQDIYVQYESFDHAWPPDNVLIILDCAKDIFLTKKSFLNDQNAAVWDSVKRGFESDEPKNVEFSLRDGLDIQGYSESFYNEILKIITNTLFVWVVGTESLSGSVVSKFKRTKCIYKSKIQQTWEAAISKSL